jgi:hypothetical protein
MDLTSVVGEPVLSRVRTTGLRVAVQQEHAPKIVVWNGHGAPKQDVGGSATRITRLGGT